MDYPGKPSFEVILKKYSYNIVVKIKVRDFSQITIKFLEHGRDIKRILFGPL